MERGFTKSKDKTDVKHASKYISLCCKAKIFYAILLAFKK